MPRYRAMDVLYPRGKTLRFVVNLLFRLLHPTWWPFSLLHWVRATTANYYARARAATEQRVGHVVRCDLHRRAQRDHGDPYGTRGEGEDVQGLSR